MSKDHSPHPYPAFRFADTLAPEPVQWLWHARIPLGRLTLLVGDPGTGKSLLAADLAARVSANAHLPFAPRPLPNADRPVGLGVLLLCPEDAAEDTLLPRLAAARADLRSICILEGVSPTPPLTPSTPLSPATRLIEDASRPGSSPHPIPDPRSPIPSSLDLSISHSLDLSPIRLPTHIPVLERSISAITVPRLVIIDPLHALLEPHGLEPTLAALSRLARAWNVAVLAIAHLVKTPSRRLIYRVRGSMSFIAAARSALLLTKDPAHPNRRALTTIKSVYGPPPPPIAFDIAQPPLDLSISRSLDLSPPWSPDLSTPRLRWRPDTPPLPEDLIELPPDARSALADACDWLEDRLAQGPQPVPDLLAAARQAGHRLDTLRRAKRILAVRSVKPANESPWHWAPSECLDKQEGLDNQDTELGHARTTS